MGTSGFYVSSVYHEFEKDGHSIYIRVTSHPPNLYLKLLKEKAYLHIDISFMEYHDWDIEIGLEEKLLRWHPNLWWKILIINNTDNPYY